MPPKKKKLLGVSLPDEMQTAGIGTTHWNIAAPRHLGALDPEREKDRRVQSRLTAHEDVPEWKRNKEEATRNYETELFEEAKRLQANRIREQEISLDKRLKKLGKAFTAQREEWNKKLEDSQAAVVNKFLGFVSLAFDNAKDLAKRAEAQSDFAKTKKKDDHEEEDRKKKKGAKKDRVQMPKSRANFLGVTTRWRDEEPELEDEEGGSVPCGQCVCGGEEFLCAHCDFIRCRKCELAMWQVPHLGALVCDRCYVWYRRAEGSSSSSSSDDEAAEGEDEHGQPRRPLKKTGHGRWQPPPKPSLWQTLAPQKLPVVGRWLREREGAAGREVLEAGRTAAEEAKDGEGFDDDDGPGYCRSCWVDSNRERKVVEYVCAHCDTIFCPYCQLEYREAKPIGALLCERCYVVWQTSNEVMAKAGPRHKAATAPFPAPLEDVRDRAAKAEKSKK